MYAILGSLLTASGVLLVALLALLFRNPAAPAWTRYELVAELLAVGVTAVLGVGIAYLALVPQQATTEGLGLVELAAIIGSLAGLVIAWRLLKVRARLKAYEAASAALPGPGLAVSNDEPPPLAPKPPAGRPARKAA